MVAARRWIEEQIVQSQDMTKAEKLWFKAQVLIVAQNTLDWIAGGASSSFRYRRGVTARSGAGVLLASSFNSIHEQQSRSRAQFAENKSADTVMYIAERDRIDGLSDEDERQNALEKLEMTMETLAFSRSKQSDPLNAALPDDFIHSRAKRRRKKKKKPSIVEINLTALGSHRNESRENNFFDVLPLIAIAATRFERPFKSKKPTTVMVDSAALLARHGGRHKSTLTNMDTYKGHEFDQFQMTKKRRRRVKKTKDDASWDKYKKHMQPKNRGHRSEPPKEQRFSTFNEFVCWIDEEALEYMATLEVDEEDDESDDPSSAEELVSEIRTELLKQLPKIRKDRSANRTGHIIDKLAQVDDADTALRVKNTTTLEYLKDNCVLKEMGLRRYQIIFDTFSVQNPGVALTSEELVYALRKVNRNLIDNSQIKYIFYVLDVLGPNGGGGANGGLHDFKTFSAVAALSERVAPVEKLIRGFVDNADFESLRQKLDRANHMFINLFQAEARIEHSGAKAVLALPLDELEYVFKAGNLSPEKTEDLLHELRDNNMDPLSYIDYLAYIPMFINLHTEAVQNPFGMYTSPSVSSVVGPTAAAKAGARNNDSRDGHAIFEQYGERQTVDLF